MNRFVALLVCIAFLMTGCSSNQAKQAGGALVTTSALLLALPLIPFAAAYHALNDTSGKGTAQFDAWAETFNPIYTERTRLIKQRNPVADARTVAAQGTLAYLPTIPGFSVYPGVVAEESSVTRVANNEAIERNELLGYLQALMADDPKDKNEKEIGYRLNQKAAYPAFSSAGFSYKEAFNKEVASLSLRPHQ